MDLHHVHIFASDMAATLDWWQRHFDAEIILDETLAGSRNVMIAIGQGRINIYDQPPRGHGPGPVHHVGIRVPDLARRWPEMQANGLTSPKGLREQDTWRYVMVQAPDGLLVELFEFDDPNSPVNRDLSTTT